MVNTLAFDTLTKDQDAATASGRSGIPIQPIHTRVPGRARFKITALYRSVSIKRRLESELYSFADIRAARGNELTGSLLVIFDRNKALEDVVRLIAAALEKPARPCRDARDPNSSRAPSPRSLSDASACLSQQ